MITLKTTPRICHFCANLKWYKPNENGADVYCVYDDCTEKPADWANRYQNSACRYFAEPTEDAIWKAWCKAKRASHPDYITDGLKRLIDAVSDVAPEDAEDEPAPPTAQDMDILTLDLTVRSYNCLARSGHVRTIADLMALTPEQFMRLRNFGRGSQREVVTKMHEHGFIDWADRMAHYTKNELYGRPQT